MEEPKVLLLQLLNAPKLLSTNDRIDAPGVRRCSHSHHRRIMFWDLLFSYGVGNGPDELSRRGSLIGGVGVFFLAVGISHALGWR